MLPFFYGRVFAEDSSGAGDSSNTSESTTESSDSADNELTDEEKAEKLKQRMEERKDKISTKLTEAKKKLLKTKCKSAQGLLTSAKARIGGVETSRNKVYDNLISRLTKLSGLLEDKGLNISELNGQIDALKAMITDIKTDIENYKQAVADAVEMTCADDPEAFRASIDEAKEKRKVIYESSQEIKSYLKDTIKTTLKNLRSELEGQQEKTTEDTSVSNDSEGEQ